MKSMPQHLLAQTALAVLVAVCLVAGAAPRAHAQCKTDVECKLDRICEGGVCVSPNAVAPAPPPHVLIEGAVPPPPRPLAERPPRVDPNVLGAELELHAALAELDDATADAGASTGLLVGGLIIAAAGITTIVVVDSEDFGPAIPLGSLGVLVGGGMAALGGVWVPSTQQRVTNAEARVARAQAEAPAVAARPPAPVPAPPPVGSDGCHYECGRTSELLHMAERGRYRRACERACAKATYDVQPCLAAATDTEAVMACEKWFGE